MTAERSDPAPARGDLESEHRTVGVMTAERSERSDPAPGTDNPAPAESPSQRQRQRRPSWRADDPRSGVDRSLFEVWVAWPAKVRYARVKAHERVALWQGWWTTSFFLTDLPAGAIRLDDDAA